MSIKVGKVGGVILFLFTSFSPNVPTLHATVMRTCPVPMLAEAIGSIAT